MNTNFFIPSYFHYYSFSYSWYNYKKLVDSVLALIPKWVKNLPSVFTKQDGKFVIIQDGAPEDQIKKVVKECPSGALKIEE